MTDVLVLAAVLAAAALVAAWWRQGEGCTVAVGGRLDAATRERIGAPPDRSLLVLFTTPTCASCAAARGVLADVAEDRGDVTLAEVDVTQAPDVARTHQVLRAPTVLVVDADDGIRARTTGVPHPGDVVGALEG